MYSILHKSKRLLQVQSNTFASELFVDVKMTSFEMNV